MTKDKVMKYLSSVKVFGKINLNSPSRAPIYYCIFNDGSALLLKANNFNMVKTYISTELLFDDELSYERSKNVDGILFWNVKVNNTVILRVVRCCDDKIKELFKNT